MTRKTMIMNKKKDNCTQKKREPERGTVPRLRFTPTAWAKLRYLCHKGDTEIGGFGLCHAEDLLLVEDFVLIPQKATEVTVAFDDTAVAEYFDAQVDQGHKPEQFARIWLHTHPGNCADPSGVDESTFERVFGGCDWAVMFILARGGQVYCRLRYNTGPGLDQRLHVEVDYDQPFSGSDYEGWDAEYEANVKRVPLQLGMAADWNEEDDLWRDMELTDDAESLLENLQYQEEFIR